MPELPSNILLFRDNIHDKQKVTAICEKVEDFGKSLPIPAFNFAVF
jgi:hypothetical protein